MKINEVDQIITNYSESELNYILSYVNGNANIQSDLFSDPYVLYGKDFKYEKGFTELRGKYGIYIFYICENLSLSYEEVKKFNEINKGASFNGTWRAMDLKEGTCFYLGSCVSSSSFTRLNEHFGKNKSTSSLCLKHPNRRNLKDKVKIFVFPTMSSGYDTTDIILRKIEQKLHNNLKPTNGSSRT